MRGSRSFPNGGSQARRGCCPNHRDSPERLAEPSLVIPMDIGIQALGRINCEFKALKTLGLGSKALRDDGGGSTGDTGDVILLPVPEARGFARQYRFQSCIFFVWNSVRPSRPSDPGSKKTLPGPPSSVPHRHGQETVPQRKGD